MFYELCLLVISLPLFGSAKNPKRAQEPGGLQWRIRFIELRGRERVSLGNDWLAVSDDTVAQPLVTLIFTEFAPGFRAPTIPLSCGLQWSEAERDYRHKAVPLACRGEIEPRLPMDRAERVGKFKFVHAKNANFGETELGQRSTDSRLRRLIS